MNNIQHFLENSLNPIIFGGAVGTELQRRGVKTSLPLRSAKANLSDQKILQEIYEDYLRAGSNILITNTFRATEWTTKKIDGDLSFTALDLTKKSLDIIHLAMENTSPEQQVFIGGCVAPLEDCYEPERTPPIDVLKREHKINVEHLLQSGGIDFIIAETQNSSMEARIICNIAKENNIPFMISFVNEGDKLINGEPLEMVIKEFQELGAISILLNCRPPKEITKGLSVFQNFCTIPYGGYGNGIGCCHDDQGREFESDGYSDNLYLEEVEKWIKLGSKIIGGCCGTTPSTIKKLANI